jgi:Type I restriction-modification system methyltransferase subunit
MLKTEDKIKQLINTELFKKGINDKIIVINEEQTQIQYKCKNNAKGKLNDSDEIIIVATFLKLIYDYNYLPQNISVKEFLQNKTMLADVIVYNESNRQILILVDCKDYVIINKQKIEETKDGMLRCAYAVEASYVWIAFGIKDEYFEIKQDSPVARISISDIPQRNGKVKYYKYTKGVYEPLAATQEGLMQKLKSAYDTLWRDGAMAPTRAFDELNKLILCKIWDEHWQDNDPKSEGEPLSFQIIYYPEDKYDLQNLKAKTELGKRIYNLYEHAKLKRADVFKDDIKLDKHKIFDVVKYLQDINLTKTDLDTKGLAFQNFLDEFFRGNFGQFFTPNPIVKFIVDSVGVKKDWKVLDTSCGSGGFLLQALRSIRDEANNTDCEKQSTSLFNYWHEFAEKHLFGIEINEQISRVAKMNMIIYDGGHTNIITNDGLKSNRTIEIENRNLNFQDETFDLIMTYPPFGSVIKADEVSYYNEYELFEKNLGFTELKDRITDDKKKWRTSQSIEILFLERCYKYLKENGYLAVILPEGVLINSTTQYVRDWLIEKFRILAVVSLPQHTFSYINSGCKSSVLFLKKHPLELTKKFEQTLIDVKAIVKSEKGLDKDERSERILKIYKEKIFQYSSDYEVLMYEIENIGYDVTGKSITGSELEEVSKQINNFIIK